MNKARRRLQKGRARLRGRRLLECVSRRLREMRRDRRRREERRRSSAAGPASPCADPQPSDGDSR